MGTVPYLVARPLTAGLAEDPRVDLVVAPPAELAEGLASGYLDVALASSVLSLGNDDLRFWMDGPVIASDGPIRSVLLFLRPGLEGASTNADPSNDRTDGLPAVRSWMADPHSRTGRALAEIVLGDATRIEPVGDAFEQALREGVDAVQLIGDPALAAMEAHPDWTVIDLGEQWRARFGLPFVFAGWILRAGFAIDGLAEILAAAADRGLERREDYASEAAGRFGLDLAFYRRYLLEDLHYRLPQASVRESLQAFAQCLALT